MRRRLLNDICQIEFVDKIDTIAGDVCVVDNNTLDKYFITPDSIECLNPEIYTPIGVVVVPASHTDDGTARIMSVLIMDYDNPDNGYKYNSNFPRILFGGNDYDVPLLNNYTTAPLIKNSSVSEFPVIQEIVEYATLEYTTWFPSDYFTETLNPYDTKTYWNGYRDCLPSPYLNDGSKNPIYHSTSNTGNCLSDMDGKGNTAKILAVDNSYSTDWQTADTIQNIGDNQYIHPAAQCCWRYHTVGTNQGEWYLPSEGELGYVVTRYNTIINSLILIKNTELFDVVTKLNVTHLGSSTEIYTDMKGSSGYGTYWVQAGIYVENERASIELSRKDDDIYFHIRAFLKIN